MPQRYVANGACNNATIIIIVVPLYTIQLRDFQYQTRHTGLGAPPHRAIGSVAADILSPQTT